MYRVIIADDEPKVSQLIKALIDWTLLGLDLVAIANDGIEALNYIEQYQPDIVITDIRMPGYDGLELIRKANLINPKIDFVIISGYQHFDYAHNAIKYGVKDYLLKPLNKDEINQTLLKMIERYQERDHDRVSIEKHQFDEIKKGHENFYEQFLLNPLKKEIAIKDINQQFRTHFVEGYFQCLVLKIDVDAGLKQTEICDMLVSKIQQIVQVRLRPVCDELIQVKSGDCLILFINKKNEAKKEVRKALHRILEESHLFRDLFNDLVVTAGMGRVVYRLGESYKSFNNAMDVIYERIDRGCGNILDYEPLEERELQDVLTSEKRRRLVDLVEILDIEGISLWLSQIKVTLESESGKTVYRVLTEVSEIVTYGLKHHLNLQLEFLEKESLNLEMQTSRKALFDHLEKNVIRWLRAAVEQKQSESNKPIRDAQKYILDHYASNLNLENISQMIGFSASYFSTLFKKETGYNFLEYVTLIRIKMAKEQLSESSKSVIEIANDVGYHDIKHFTKQFKKITGLNPSQYRKLYY